MGNTGEPRKTDHSEDGSQHNFISSQDRTRENSKSELEAENPGESSHIGFRASFLSQASPYFMIWACFLICETKIVLMIAKTTQLCYLSIQVKKKTKQKQKNF